MKLGLNVQQKIQHQKPIKKEQSKVSFNGGLQEIAVKKGFKAAVPFTEISGLLTAIVSTVGFGVGGFGLFSDFLAKKESKNAPKSQEPVIVFEPVKLDLYKNFHNTRDIRQLSIPKHEAGAEAEAHGEGEFGNIQPTTKIGKTGLAFAKVGIMFSGIAGFFNGLAMKIPLMSLGETVNIASSPIINTPTGFGLFNIGLATIFAGRALENDPALKLNEAVLKSKGTLKEKAAYVGKNMALSANEVLNSTKEVGRQFGNLFKSTATEEGKLLKQSAKMFFRDNIGAIMPSSVTWGEKMTAAANKTVEVGMKSQPHRMHSASLLLATGGALLTLFGILKQTGAVKNDAGVKTSFKIAEAGGALDNISLAYSGMEKMAMGHKAAGLPLAVSGFTILAGTPNAEKDYGRAIQWIGTAALFLTFVVERGQGLNKAIKGIKKVNKDKVLHEGADLIRQWEFNIPKAIDKKTLKPYLKDLNNMMKRDRSEIVGVDQLIKNLYGEVKIALKEGKSLKQVRKDFDAGRIQEQARERMLSADAPKEIQELVKFMDEVKDFMAKGKFKSTAIEGEAKDIQQIIKEGKSSAQKELHTHLRNLKDDKGKRMFRDELINEVKVVTEGSPDEIAKSVISQNVKNFGENYKPELEKIVDDMTIPELVRKEAEAALNKMAS